MEVYRFLRYSLIFDTDRMELTQYEQVASLIEKSFSILLMTSTTHSIDGLASVLALSNYLTKKNKTHDVVASSIDFPEKYDFLPGVKAIRDTISTSNKFLITLDVSCVNVKEFTYDVKNNFLTISITPESGRFYSRDVMSRPSDWSYDLIITVGAHNLSSLGSLYEEYREFFFKTPIVAFDYRATHERYGAINAVDLSAVCVSEAVYGYLSDRAIGVFDKDLGTLLLAGLMGSTNGFRGDVVTPRSLRIGAELVAHGADKSLIVRELYGHKNVELLNLCGVALSRLQLDESIDLAYLWLEQAEVHGKNLRSSELIDVIEEFLSTIPNLYSTLFSFPLSDLASRHVIRFSGQDIGRILAIFNPKRHEGFLIIDFTDGSLAENQMRIRDHLKKHFSNEGAG